jgi:hypothetical protein
MTEDDLYIEMEKLRRKNQLVEQRIDKPYSWLFREKIKNFSVNRGLVLLVTMIFILVTCSLISSLQ